MDPHKIKKVSREKYESQLSRERLEGIHGILWDISPGNLNDLLQSIELHAGVGKIRALEVVEQLESEGKISQHNNTIKIVKPPQKPITTAPKIKKPASFLPKTAKNPTPTRVEKIVVQPSKKTKQKVVKKHNLDLQKILECMMPSVPVLPHDIAMQINLEFSKGSPNRLRLANALDELMLGGFITEQNGRFVRPLDKVIDLESAMAGVIRKRKGRSFFVSATEGEKDIEITNCHLANGTIVTVVANDDEQKSVRILSEHGNIDEEKGDSILTLAEYKIPNEFPQDVLDETIGMSVPSVDEVDKDYRHYKFIAVDPKTAKDKDDAIYVQRRKHGGLKIMVAVADVSRYVLVGSKIWKEALRRGNSTYLPGFTAHMLPPVLSNGLCSLHQGEVRAAMVTTINIDKFGNIENDKTESALIKCHASLNYDEVQEAIEGKATGKMRELYNKYISKAQKAAEILDKVADERGQLNLSTAEQRIDYSKETGFSLSEERDNMAHRIVANIMILNNLVIPDELEKRGKTIISRAHDEPNPKACDRYLPEIEKLGLNMGDEETWADRVRALAKKSHLDKKHGSKIRKFLIRMQSRAEYVIGRMPHYGLGLKNGYTHFTSPIRRFSDLLVHSQLSNHEHHDPDFFTEANLEKVVKHISMTERRSEAAEEKAKARAVARWLSGNMGQVFNARVLNVDLEANELEVAVLSQKIKTYVQIDEFESYKQGDILKIIPRKVDQIKGTLHFHLAVNNQVKRLVENTSEQKGSASAVSKEVKKPPRMKQDRYCG